MKITQLNNNLVVALLAAILVSNVYATNEQAIPPEGLNVMETVHLDKAWVNPDFSAADYKHLAIDWVDFEYRPAKNSFMQMRRSGSQNYELSDKAKMRLTEETHEIFKKELQKGRNFSLVDLKEADQDTIIVRLVLRDIVNKVPDIHQNQGNSILLMRYLGTMTLDIEFLDGNNQALLFKGFVREEIEAQGNDLELTNSVTAQQHSRKQIKRWAIGLKKNIDDMQ